MIAPINDSNILTPAGVAAISVVGGISKSAQWRDTKTGNFSLALMISGIATCLIMASIVIAAGAQWGIEPWAQVMAGGVLCYVGPDPIIRKVAGIILTRAGEKENGPDPQTPKP